MAERNSDFWYSVELNAPSSLQWYREEKDFGMGGCLDNALERNVGCSLVVVGPLLDGFIKRIGKGFRNKLACSKLTGMQQLQSLFFSWPIFRRFAKLVRGYGGIVNTFSNGKKPKNVVITFTRQVAIRKIWHPYRLSNEN